MQVPLSWGNGCLFSGGRQRAVLAIYILSRVRPSPSIIPVRSRPDRPTKGRPSASSSLPGASPIKIAGAVGHPSPNTTCERPCVPSGQR